MERRTLSVFSMVAALALLLAACATDDNDVTNDVERPEDVLRLGYILPETGDLAFLGPPQIRAVEMAVAEMTEAGGPLGLAVELLGSDESDTVEVASASADRLLAEGVHAIIGAAASGRSLGIIDQITGAGVVQCSASNTSPTFSAYPDNGFYFRTAPSDALQGPVLAEVLLEDGHERVALLGRGDDYGRGLVEATAGALVDAGAEVAMEEIYDPGATTFDAEAAAAAAEEPDAVVTVPFAEGVQLIQALLEAGFTPDQLYGADGIRSTSLNEDVDPGNENVLDGMKGTAPNPGAVPGFIDSLLAFDPDLEETVFAPQAYDCTVLIGLAVVSAGTVDPTVVKDHIIPLSQGEVSCSGFAECAALLEGGQTINYQFASGTIELDDVGEPVNGTYEVWGWVDGALETLDTRDISVLD